MKNRKVITAILLFSLVFGLVVVFGIFGGSLVEKDKLYETSYFSFKSDEALLSKEINGFDVYFENLTGDVLIFGRSESKEDLAIFGFEDLSLKDYASSVYDIYDDTLSKLTLSDNKRFYYFTYNYKDGDDVIFYVGTIFEDDDRFWLVSFACEEDNKKEYEERFIEWANTVKFK